MAWKPSLDRSKDNTDAVGPRLIQKILSFGSDRHLERMVSYSLNAFLLGNLQILCLEASENRDGALEK